VNILEWLRKALTAWNGAVSFVLVLVFSAALISLDSAGKRVFHEVMVGTLLRPVHIVLSLFDGTLLVHRTNTRLTLENAALRAENDRLQQALRQIPRLEEMERFRAATDLRLKPARVIAEDPGRFQAAWVIDLGAAESVAVNMPVVTARGIVGKTARVYHRHSLVQLLSDPGFKVSVQSDRSRARGIMETDGPGRLVARFPVGSDVALGDTLVTTRLGGVFPKGLRVGAALREVTRQEQEHQDVLRSFRVAPFQELNTVEELFVLIEADRWTLRDTLP
jgi:rod shape-determining protein MreC